MTDLLLVATLIAFFALATAFVSACDRIVGADEELVVAPLSTIDEEDVA